MKLIIGENSCHRAIRAPEDILASTARAEGSLIDEEMLKNSNISTLLEFEYLSHEDNYEEKFIENATKNETEAKYPQANKRHNKCKLYASGHPTRDNVSQYTRAVSLEELLGSDIKVQLYNIKGKGNINIKAVFIRCEAVAKDRNRRNHLE